VPKKSWIRNVRAKVIARDGGACFWCGASPIEGTLDHVVPASRGGRFTLDNLVLACRPCNAAKADMMPDEWAQFMAENPEWWRQQPLPPWAVTRDFLASCGEAAAE
jgi:5-methylcytosine-specific restriction endonuclease McrA